MYCAGSRYNGNNNRRHDPVRALSELPGIIVPDFVPSNDVDQHLRQIGRVNPKVNAIVTLVAERAVEAAARADEMQARGEQLSGRA